MLFLGLVLRLAFVFFATSGHQVGKWDDDGDYFRYARTMVLHGVIATENPQENPKTLRARRGPVFFTFQYLIFKLHGLDNYLPIRIYLSVLSLLIPLGVYVFCARVWGETEAKVGLIWATFHPTFIYYGAQVQSDALALVFSTWGLVLLMTQKNMYESLSSGFILGVGILCRSQFSLVAAAGFFWILANQKFDFRYRRAMMYGLMCLLPLLPWWVRNYRVFHQFVPFTTEGGYTLCVGFNENADGGGVTTYAPSPPPELNEIERDRWYFNKAVGYMKSHPKHSLQLAISKFFRFWGIIPRIDRLDLKLMGFLTYIILFPFFFWGLWLWREKFWSLGPIVGLCIYYSILHLFFPAVMRYRLPIEPFMVAVASATLVSALGSLRLKSGK